MAVEYSKRSLAIPAEITDRILPAFYQVELLNYLPDFLNLSDRYS